MWFSRQLCGEEADPDYQPGDKAVSLESSVQSQRFIKQLFCIGRSSDIICDFVCATHSTMFVLMSGLSWDFSACEFSACYDPILLERQHN